MEEISNFRIEVILEGQLELRRRKASVQNVDLYIIMLSLKQLLRARKTDSQTC